MIKDYKETYDKLAIAMQDLGAKIPTTLDGFGQLHRASIEDGALTSKAKDLIALGIAITVRCDGCIAYHVHDALKTGATKEEIFETIGVAIMMGGGPSLVYGCEALEAVKQLEKIKAS